MVVIDAHQHVWDLDRVRYPWLTPATGVLYRSYDFDELLPDLDACGVTGTVLVQSADSVEETRWMQAVADAHERVKAIVAWVPLDRPAEAEKLLDDYANDQRIVGIRHLIHDEPDEDWVVRPEVQEGLSLLAARGLTFDVVAVTSRHLQHVPTIAERHPELKIVIDHLAKPLIATGGWQPWADELRAAAEHPHVHAKVSGLNTAADMDSWEAADLEPYIDHALDVFGADRLMYGGDWPVTLLAGDYQQVWGATTLLLDKLTADARAEILGGTAVRFYGIDLDEGPGDA